MANNEGKFDLRNKLNDLTGKEWLKLTKSFWMSESCSDDKDAMKHPAPFLIKDIEKLISMFTKRDMIVLDPFAGSGTTAISAFNLNRKSINIDLNEKYKYIALDRFNKKNMKEKIDYEYIVGDSKDRIKNINSEIDYIVTSPPYHNILRNKASGLRTKSDKYRTGSRIGIEYYSEYENDLGNQETYIDFLNLFSNIMLEAYKKLKNDKYCSIIISDFTVDKREICVEADIVRTMEKIGYSFVGNIVLLQDKKPLYPFGYPYAFKINHMHQNIINFKK